jgi:hypothetical protein
MIGYVLRQAVLPAPDLAIASDSPFVASSIMNAASCGKPWRPEWEPPVPGRTLVLDQ